jgi:hypothetical protein
MTSEFAAIIESIRSLVSEWETRLSGLDGSVISERQNEQGRNIKQITGHLIDSASNNLHRIIHLQYGSDPLQFPNYSTEGNNDRWIAIQNFRDEDWHLLVELWKYSNLHIAHVIGNIDPNKLDKRWIAAPGEEVTLRDMVVDFPRHLLLHLSEIEELL